MIDDFFEKKIINKGITNKLFLKRNFGYVCNGTKKHYIDLGNYIVYLYEYARNDLKILDYNDMQKIYQKMHDELEIDELKNKFIIIYQYNRKIQVPKRIYEYLGMFKYIDKFTKNEQEFNIYEKQESDKFDLIPFYYPSYEEGKGYIRYLQYDFIRNNDLNDLNDLNSIREDDYNTSNYIIDNMKLLLMEKLKNNTNLKEKFTSLINNLDDLEVLLYKTSFEYENIEYKQEILDESSKLTDDFIRMMTDGE